MLFQNQYACVDFKQIYNIMYKEYDRMHLYNIFCFEFMSISAHATSLAWSGPHGNCYAVCTERCKERQREIEIGLQREIKRERERER